MPTLTLRQDLGNTEPRSANVTVKYDGLSNIEVDNNFNNLNNLLEYAAGTLVLAFNQANSAYSNSNTKFSSTGGTVSGDIIVVGEISSNTYKGIIDAGFF